MIGWIEFKGRPIIMQRLVFAIIGIIIRILKGDLRTNSFKEIIVDPEENKDIGFDYTMYAIIIVGSIIIIYTIIKKLIF